MRPGRNDGRRKRMNSRWLARRVASFGLEATVAWRARTHPDAAGVAVDDPDLEREADAMGARRIIGKTALSSVGRPLPHP